MMRRAPSIVLASLACVMLLSGCHSVPSAAPAAVAAATGSGFLSDYGRLRSTGTPRDRYLSYSGPDTLSPTVQSVYLQPLTRYPADARFAGVDEAVVAELVAFADLQLRLQLGARLKLAASAASADVTVQAVVSGVAPQPAGKSMLDVIPLRLITNPIKEAAFGELLAAALTVEVRISTADPSRVLRESLYQLMGEDIGRSADPKTRIDAASLKPAIENWSRAFANQLPAAP